MWLVWMGVVLLLLKWFEVGPVAEWSWWWVIAPFLASFVWFEFLEKLFGRDKRQLEMIEYQKRAQERISDTFKQPGRS